MSNLQFNVGVSKRFMLFLCASVICMILGSVIVQIIVHGGITTPRVRIATVFQDITFFILPAIVTAVIICRQPADFLMIRHCPGVVQLLLTIATVIAAVPMMNCIIEWNMSLHLPDSLHAVEEWMKESEESAAKFTDTLLGGTGINSFIVAVLIVGFLAGFSEEIFFRGTIQRLFITSKVNVHIAVWSTAFIFSAIHFQFFGFVPRLLLGVFFGYAVAWSGNLWLGVAGHFTNNVIAAAGMTIAKSPEIVEEAETVLTGSSSSILSGTSPAAAIISTAITVLLIFALRKVSRTSCD